MAPKVVTSYNGTKGCGMHIMEPKVVASYGTKGCGILWHQRLGALKAFHLDRRIVLFNTAVIVHR